MEQETLFTASKWDILTELRVKPRSPMELANILNTSVANISQQLRLLEMAGLVESKRISNREKGLPRVLYSLAGNLSYIIATAREFVDKKFHKLSERNKVVLRIWFLDDPTIHYYLEKAFWSIDEYIKKIDALLFDTTQPDLTLIIVTEDSDLKKKIKDTVLTNPDGKKRRVKFAFWTPAELKKKKGSPEEHYILYDPESLINGKDSEKRDDLDNYRDDNTENGDKQ